MNRIYSSALALAFAAGGLLSAVGCGPSNSGSNNNVQQDAYVFPDSAPRPDAAPCEDRCTNGETQCVTGGFQECATDFDSDDCTEWGPVNPCGNGEACVNGACEAACTNECTDGSVKCNADGSATQDCELNGGSGCWEWGAEVACAGGETCSAGVCATGCVEECTQGSRQCSGDGYQLCDDFDSDACMDWGPITPCTGGDTCSDGYCDSTCTNECTTGATQCAGTTGAQTCGDYDSDPCLEWGPIVPCPAGETCSMGQCDVTCTNECAAMNDTQCTTSGGGFQVCDYPAGSTCLAWGPQVSCAVDETCVAGACVLVCDCDFNAGICEPDSPGSTTACSCDDDCIGGSPCETDGHCDTWCPPNADVDCDCACDYNEYCEAGTQGGTDTCACDPDCEPNEWACDDDGHCDTWCTAGVDPDCPAGSVDPCRARWMLVGYREADQMWLGGDYLDPDPDEGAPWVQLSPGLSSGTAEAFVEFAEENSLCVDQIRIEAYGYDDSLFGDGAEVYIYNWDTFQFDLLPDETINTPEGFWMNTVIDPTSYLLCGSGAQAKCYIDIQIGASAWDQTHLWDVWVDVHMTP